MFAQSCSGHHVYVEHVERTSESLSSSTIESSRFWGHCGCTRRGSSSTASVASSWNLLVDQGRETYSLWGGTWYSSRKRRLGYGLHGVNRLHSLAAVLWSSVSNAQSWVGITPKELWTGMNGVMERLGTETCARNTASSDSQPREAQRAPATTCSQHVRKIFFSTSKKVKSGAI